MKYNTRDLRADKQYASYVAHPENVPFYYTYDGVAYSGFSSDK